MPAPHPGQNWKHGWVPVTPKAFRQKNHGKLPGPDTKLGRAMARATSDGDSPSQRMDSAIRARSRPAAPRTSAPSGGSGGGASSRAPAMSVTDPQGRRGYVTGPDIGEAMSRAKQGGMKASPAGGDLDRDLAKAPKQVREIWDAARENGWNAQLSIGGQSGRYQLLLRGPDGKPQRLQWDANGNLATGTPLGVAKLINEIKAPSRRKREREALMRQAALRRQAAQKPQLTPPPRPRTRKPADQGRPSSPQRENPNIPALDSQGLPAARRVGEVSRGPDGSMRIKVETREGIYDAEVRNGKVSVTRNGRTFSERIPEGQDPTRTVQELIERHRRPVTVSPKEIRPGMRIYTGDPNDRVEVIKVERKSSGTQFRSDPYVLHYRNLNTGRVSTMGLGTAREPMGLRVYPW